jgi:hypothetical protein
MASWIGWLTASAWTAGCGPDAAETHAPQAGVGSSGGRAGTHAGAGSPISGGTDAPDGPAVQFERDVYPIVGARCAIAGCHVTGTTTNHFTDFSTPGGTYVRWVNAPGFDFCSEPPDGEIFVRRTIVVPGAPEQSYLVALITSTREEFCPQMHNPRMPPPPMPPLAGEQVATIVSWIREGALDD